MRWLVTGDLHLNDKHRDRYRHEFMRQLQTLAYDRRVDRIIILGDITEEKDHHPAWLVNKVVEHIRRLARCAPVTIERGNHDYADITNPFFEFLGKFEGVEWISNPDAHHLPGCLFLPHTRNHKRDWVNFNFRKFKWIFTHNTFEGAQNESGHAMRGIPASVFPAGTHIVSGDVHVPQTFEGITYVGAPYTVDFGDKFKPRVLLLEGDRMTSIPCTGPQKRLVEITWPLKGANERIIDEALKDRVNSGDIVKVRINLQPDQYDRWDSIQDVVRRWADQKRVELITVLPEMLDRVVRPTTKRTRRDDMDLMKEYVRKQQVDDRTLRTGRILMEGGS